MNELLKEKATESLIDIIDSVTEVKDFAIEQAPDVVRQLLTWEFTFSLINFLAGVLCLTVSIVVLVVTFKNGSKKGWTDSGDFIRASLALGLVLSVLFFITGICVAASCLTWLQIAIAPKLFLIEYAADLIN